MSTTTLFTAWRASPDYRGLRFGRETGADGSAAQRSIEWMFRRSGALVPRQWFWLFASLGVISLGVAATSWLRASPPLMPLVWLELLVVGAVLLVQARHGADRECIALCGDELTVEQVSGRRVKRVAFQPAWVRVEPEHGDRSLIELSGQGRRVAVGRFVQPDSRFQLAEELRWALRRWERARHAAHATR